MCESGYQVHVWTCPRLSPGDCRHVQYIERTSPLIVFDDIFKYSDFLIDSKIHLFKAQHDLMYSWILSIINLIRKIFVNSENQEKYHTLWSCHIGGDPVGSLTHPGIISH